MKNNSDTEFENLVEKKTGRTLSKFYSQLEKDRSPSDLITEEDGRLNTLLSDTHNSNKVLNAGFFEIQKLLRSDKNLSYSQAIKDYHKKSIKKQKQLIDFATSILSLHKARSIIVSKMPKTKKQPQFGGSEESTPNKTEFTLARKVLMLSFLMNGHFEGRLVPDKTTIARFIESLISEKTSKDISNTNLYGKVKTLFFNQSEANERDIQFVRNIFQTLGLASLVNDIDRLPTKKIRRNQ